MRKTIYFLLIGAFALCTTSSFAQQQAIYTNYLLNPFYYNPAISGADNVLKTNLNYRSQWTGFDGAPKTFTGSLYGSIKNKMKHGMGTMLVNDKTGLTSRSAFYMNYSYHVKLGKKHRLGFGVSPGIMQYRIKLYDAQVADAGDDLLTGNVLSQNAIDVNAGFYFFSEKFFFGGSFNQVFGKEVPLLNYNEQLKMHYNIMTGYTFALNKKWDLQPSILARYTPAVPVQADFSLRTTYMKNIFLGMTYRLDDAASLSLGYVIKNRCTIAYSYDYSFTSMKNYNSGSHEVGFVYIITAKRKSLDEKDEELNNSIMDALKKKKKKEEEEEAE